MEKKRRVKQIKVNGLGNSNLKKALFDLLNDLGLLFIESNYSFIEINRMYSDHETAQILSFTSDRNAILVADNKHYHSKNDFCFYRKEVETMLGEHIDNCQTGFYDYKAGMTCDFCLSNEKQTRYLLFYCAPWEGFSYDHATQDKESMIDFWYWYNRKILDVYNENKERAILVDLNCVIHNRAGLIHQIKEVFKLDIEGRLLNEDYSRNYTFPVANEKLLNLAAERPEVLLLYKSLLNQSDMVSSFSISIEHDQLPTIGDIYDQYGKILLNETLKLKKEKEKNVQSIDILNATVNRLSTAVKKLEKRIYEIEHSRLWKLKKLINKIKQVFKNSTSTSKKDGPLKYLKFFITKHFFRVFRKLMKVIFKYFYLLFEDKPVKIISLEDYERNLYTVHSDPYHVWMARNMPRKSDLNDYENNIPLFAYKPFFSIVVPVYNPPEKYFKKMIDSVLNQVYQDWELCLSDDHSSNPNIKKIINEYAKKDSRIKCVFRNGNGHISACSNSALSIADGEFVVLLDHDDLLTEDALYQVAYALNQHPESDFIYSDEDKIDDRNRHKEPHFKPDWCPDNLLSRNYFGHMVVLRNSIMKEIGGFREGFEGSQDYDLFLRFTEKTNHIYHIPKVLYHWRLHSESASTSEEVKPYAYIAAQKALQEALARRNEQGDVDFLPFYRGYSIRYQIKNNPKVSILIPNKNKAKLLEGCLNSIFNQSSYQNYEVIVIDNGSTEVDVFDLYKKSKKDQEGRFNFISLDIPFNFSALINYGASKATGEFLLLLNNDTEVISEDWLEGMIEYAQRESTGVVGVKLLYSDETIQHAGVVIGLGGAAGHVFVGNHKDDSGYFNYINSVNNYSALTGACIMVRKEVFDGVGGFDEEFATEYNDIDFCLKIKAKGFHNVYLPHVELFHYESLSRGNIYATKDSYKKHKSEIGLFKKKWPHFIKADPCYSINLNLGVHDFGIKI